MTLTRRHIKAKPPTEPPNIAPTASGVVESYTETDFEFKDVYVEAAVAPIE